MYQIQKTKLKERRDNVEVSDKVAWKKFFTEAKPDKEVEDEAPKNKKPGMILKNASAPPPAKKKKKKTTNYSD